MYNVVATAGRRGGWPIEPEEARLELGHRIDVAAVATIWAVKYSNMMA